MINSNHRRDRSKSVEEWMSRVAGCFSRPDRARAWLEQIHRRYPRYMRDQLQFIQQALKDTELFMADQSLDFCLSNELYNGRDFEQVVQVYRCQAPEKSCLQPIKLLHSGPLEKADQSPQSSDLNDYELIINPENHSK